jgi:hypothetical protein
MFIVISRSGGDGRLVKQAPIENEKQLEDYLEKHLNVFPWDEIEPGADLLPIGRQLGTVSGPSDMLAVDGSWNLYVLETKLDRNADKRRIVAQVLDYGASLWESYGDGHDFTKALDAKFGLQEKLRAHFGLDDVSLAQAVETIERNLEAGRIRFVIAMDAIEDERLKTLVRFLNQNSSFKVYLVELKFFKDADVEVVVPTIHGTESAKMPSRSRASAARASLDLESFVSAIPTEGREVIGELCRFSAERTKHRFSPVGMFAAMQSDDDNSWLYKLHPDGHLRIHLPHDKAGEMKDVYAKFRSALVAEGFPLPQDAQEGGTGYPLTLDQWRDHVNELERAISKV